MTFSKRALARKAEGMNLAEFIAAGLGIKVKRQPKRKVWLADEGERAIHRKGDVVSIKREYQVDRNRYDPQTCSRPKEAAKASRRAARMNPPMKEAAE